MKWLTRTTGSAIIFLLILTSTVVASGYLQPQPPMVVEGIVYVDGVRAADGTLVEASIEDEVVASFDTVTSGDQQGFYIMRVDGEEGDEISFSVDGEAAGVLVEGETEEVLAYEPGFNVADLIVGGEPPTFTLTMAVEGNGQTVPEVGDHSYPEGASVRIWAVPDAGWEFDGWLGDVADPEFVNAQVVVDGDQTVTARFVALQVSTPTPEPTSAATDTPEPAPTGTPTSEPSPTPDLTATPEPSPTAAETGETATEEPEGTASEAASGTATVASPTSGAAPGATATSGEAGEGTPAPGSPTPEEAPDSTATAGAEGEETPAPGAAEEQGSEGISGLLIAAVALAALGLVAVGFGIYGLRQQS
jgi:hypothetical protein